MVTDRDGWRIAAVVAAFLLSPSATQANGPTVEAREPPVGAQPGFLHHVFSILLVTSHTEAQTEKVAAVPLDEHTEGLLIPRAGPLHGGSVVQFHPVCSLDY